MIVSGAVFSFVLTVLKEWFSIFLSLLSIIWLLRDIENAGISAHLIRAALAIGLIAFIAGIVI